MRTSPRPRGAGLAKPWMETVSAPLEAGLAPPGAADGAGWAGEARSRAGWNTTTYSMRERMGRPSREDGANLAALTAAIAASANASGASRGAREVSTADSTPPARRSPAARPPGSPPAGTPAGKGATMGASGTASTSAAAAGAATKRIPRFWISDSARRRENTGSHHAPLTIIELRHLAVARLARLERVRSPSGVGVSKTMVLLLPGPIGAILASAGKQPWTSSGPASSDSSPARRCTRPRSRGAWSRCS